MWHLENSSPEFQVRKNQQLTYGVVSEGFFAENSAEILRKFRGKFAETIRFIAPGKGAEMLRKVCGNSRKFAENFLQ